MPAPHTEVPHESAHAFRDKSVRLAFIRKVYSILMVQLLVTGLIVMLFVLDETVSNYFRENQIWLIVAVVIVIVCLIVMSCFESARRTVPMNYVLLYIFTLAEGFLLGVISSTYEAKEVLLAIGICAFLCFVLTVFAFQTKIDFTLLGGALLTLLVILIFFGLVMMFFPNSNVMRLIYACFGSFIFSIYLIYDTQLMMGGNHKYAISPEEYIFAALTLYIDIINLFLFILMIIGGSRRSGSTEPEIDMSPSKYSERNETSTTSKQGDETIHVENV